MSLILSIGLVGCAANNPTKDSDVVRDRSVEDRIRDGEALSTTREAAERSAQREKDKSTGYGSKPGVGGSRKTTPGSNTAPMGSGVDASEKAPKTAAKTDSLGSLASLFGKSSSSGGSGMGMWLAAGAALLLVKGGDLLSGGGKGLSALLGGNKDKTHSKNAEVTSDLGGKSSGSETAVGVGKTTGGEVQITSAAKTPPMKPEGGRPTESTAGSEELAKLLRIQVPLTKPPAPSQDKSEPKPKTPGYFIRLKKPDGSVSMIGPDGPASSNNTPALEIELAPATEETAQQFIDQIGSVAKDSPLSGLDRDLKAEALALNDPSYPALEKALKNVLKRFKSLRDKEGDAK